MINLPNPPAVISRLLGSPKRALAFSALVFLVVLAGPFGRYANIARAACTPPATSYGTVTSTVSVPTTGTYRVFSRIMAPDTTSNSYTLDVDGTTCGIVVGGNASIPANTWTWVDYKNGTTTSKIDLVNLTAGNHTLVMTGTEPNVKLDRIVLTTDLTCPISGTGDNCANPPDTTGPIVNIDSPASGQVAPDSMVVSVSASDVPSGVQKVELYLDNAATPHATDTTAAYSFTVNTTTLSIGTHTMYARAYDTVGNDTNSSNVTFIVKDKTAPTNVTVTSPTAGSTKSGTITLSGSAADNVAPTKMEFYFDSDTTPKATDPSGPSPFSASFDTKTLTDGTHTVKAKAFDAAGNNALSPAVSFTVDNTPPPVDDPPTIVMQHPTSSEVVSGSSYTVSALATDDIGITQVQFYIDGAAKTPVDTTTPYFYVLNSTALTNGAHTFFAKVTDTGGHTVQSATVTATVNNVTYIDEDVNESTCVNLFDLSALKPVMNQTVASGDRRNVNNSADNLVNLFDLSQIKPKLDFNCADGTPHWP